MEDPHRSCFTGASFFQVQYGPTYLASRSGRNGGKKEEVVSKEIGHEIDALVRETSQRVRRTREGIQDHDSKKDTPTEKVLIGTGFGTDGKRQIIDIGGHKPTRGVIDSCVTAHMCLAACDNSSGLKRHCRYQLICRRPDKYNSCRISCLVVQLGEQPKTETGYDQQHVLEADVKQIPDVKTICTLR